MVLLASSFFLVLGLLSFDFRSWFLLVGILLKLGIFPFLSWLYEVVVFSKWVVV